MPVYASTNTVSKVMVKKHSDPIITNFTQYEAAVRVVSNLIKSNPQVASPEGKVLQRLSQEVERYENRCNKSAVKVLQRLSREVKKYENRCNKSVTNPPK